jgi:hypothetical protein
MQEIKEFVAKIEERREELRVAATNEEYDLCERLANEYGEQEVHDLLRTAEYQALKMLAQPSGMSIIAKSIREDNAWRNPKNPEKQTLSNFIQERHSSPQNISTTELMRLTSCYLEQQDER